MFDYGRKMLQVVGDTVYSLEEEVEKKVKKLVSSGELTEEEGKELTKEMEKQRGAYLQRLEHQLEALTEAILTRFSVPAKDDLEHLKECIERLEKCIENLEQKLSSKGQ